MDKNKKIGFAVIGYGGMGSWHASTCADDFKDTAELIGIYDIKPERRAAAEAEGIHAFSSREELLADERIDLVTVATPNDVQKEIAIAAMAAGKAAAFLAIEGAEAVREDPGLLEAAYEKGVRMVSLVWNLPNGLSGSCQTGEGLTEKGKRFFRRAQKLGMLVDVSHLSEKGFWDMAELAEKPIVASHSDSFAVCPHPRNLTDAQFQAICDLGGTAGLNLYGPFLTDGPRVTFDDLRRHLDHFLDLGGEGHLALGADLDGCSVLPEGFAALNDYETLGRYLADAGYPDETIQNLFCNSLMKVVKTCIM